MIVTSLYCCSGATDDDPDFDGVDPWDTGSGVEGVPLLIASRSRLARSRARL